MTMVLLRHDLVVVVLHRIFERLLRLFIPGRSGIVPHQLLDPSGHPLCGLRPDSPVSSTGLGQPRRVILGRGEAILK